jgi:hypothetical protein
MQDLHKLHEEHETNQCPEWKAPYRRGKGGSPPSAKRQKAAEKKKPITVVYNRGQTAELDIKLTATYQQVLQEAANLTGKAPGKLRLLRGNGGWLGHIITEDEQIREGDTVQVVHTDYHEGDFRNVLVHVHAQKDLKEDPIRRRTRTFKVAIEESIADLITPAGLTHMMYLAGARVYLLNQDFSQLEEVEREFWLTEFEKFNCSTAEVATLRLPTAHAFLVTSAKGPGPWVPQTKVSEQFTHLQQVVEDKKLNFNNTGEDHRLFDGITIGELQLQTTTYISTMAGAIEASTTDMGKLTTTSYKLDDASEFLKLVIQGGGRTTHYLLDATTRVGSCFPTLGAMINDRKATLTIRSKTGSDGEPTPTKELAAGSKFTSYSADPEKIDNMNTLHCIFENIDVVNEDSDYTSTENHKKEFHSTNCRTPRNKLGQNQF